MVFRKCPNCEYTTDRKSNYDKHINKKFDCSQNIKYINKPIEIIQNIPNQFHNIPFQNINNINNIDNEDNFGNLDEIDNRICCFCSKSYSNKGNLTKHLKKCQVKIQKENEKKNETEKIKKEFEELKKQNKLLENKINKIDNYVCKTNEINKSIKKLETSIPANTNVIIANQLIDKIIEKDKKMEKMQEIIVSSKPKIYNKILDDDYTDIVKIEDKVKENEKENKNEKVEEKPSMLILNNDIIEYRKTDGYINATQLCKAGGKLFGHWHRLDSTKQIIFELAKKTFNHDYLIIKSKQDSNIQIWISYAESLLIDIKKGNNSEHLQGTWIHPDLAIQLAQWLSPLFALQVSYWIRTLFVEGKVELNLKLLKEKDDQIADCKKRIKLLENQLLKKQSRSKYDNSKNVVYIITNEHAKSKRTYTIGKTIDLVKRISSYDKLLDHEVIYYKSFETEEDMNIAENMVLRKLNQYKEIECRDRFVLPISANIKLFSDTIDNAHKFLNK